MIVDLLAADPNAQPATLAYLAAHAHTDEERLALLAHPNWPAGAPLDGLAPSSAGALHAALELRPAPTVRQRILAAAAAVPGVRWEHARAYDDLTAAEVEALWATRASSGVLGADVARAMLSNAATPPPIVRVALRMLLRQPTVVGLADLFLVLVTAHREGLTLGAARTWNLSRPLRRALHNYRVWARAHPRASVATYLSTVPPGTFDEPWSVVAGTTPDPDVAAAAVRLGPADRTWQAALTNSRLHALHLAHASAAPHKDPGTLRTVNSARHALFGPAELAYRIARADAQMRDFALTNPALTAAHLSDIAAHQQLTYDEAMLIAAHPHTPDPVRRDLLARTVAVLPVGTYSADMREIAEAAVGGDIGQFAAVPFAAFDRNLSPPARHFARLYAATHHSSPVSIPVAHAAVMLEGQFCGTLGELLDTAAAIATP